MRATKRLACCVGGFMFKVTIISHNGLQAFRLASTRGKEFDFRPPTIYPTCALAPCDAFVLTNTVNGKTRFVALLCSDALFATYEQEVTEDA